LAIYYPPAAQDIPSKVTSDEILDVLLWLEKEEAVAARDV